jgi:hypothetical protein
MRLRFPWFSLTFAPLPKAAPLTRRVTVLPRKAEGGSTDETCGGATLSRIETSLELAFAVARSGFSSPLRSEAATIAVPLPAA